jgi:hypothetical protein
MITRIVRMHFRPGEREAFLAIFNASKDYVGRAPGGIPELGALPDDLGGNQGVVRGEGASLVHGGGGNGGRLLNISCVRMQTLCFVQFQAILASGSHHTTRLDLSTSPN